MTPTQLRPRALEGPRSVIMSHFSPDGRHSSGTFRDMMRKVRDMEDSTGAVRETRDMRGEGMT
jgi:hypothetical protein